MSAYRPDYSTDHAPDQVANKEGPGSPDDKTGDFILLVANFRHIAW